LFVSAALFQLACTWTSTCARDGEGTDRCDDSVVAADHPTGTGSAELSCGAEGKAKQSWLPKFEGIAECSFAEGALTLHLGSGGCHHVTLVIPEFSGAGSYQLTPDAPEGLSIAMYEPDTGCQTGASASLGHAASCGAESSSCGVVIGGDFSIERGGDLDVTVDCQRLLYSGPNATCGTCTPARPIQVSFRDCDWGD